MADGVALVLDGGAGICQGADRDQLRGTPGRSRAQRTGAGADGLQRVGQRTVSVSILFVECARVFGGGCTMSVTHMHCRYPACV